MLNALVYFIETKTLWLSTTIEERKNTSIPQSLTILTLLPVQLVNYYLNLLDSHPSTQELSFQVHTPQLCYVVSSKILPSSEVEALVLEHLKRPLFLKNTALITP